jgi:hypothetical protein
LGIYIDITGAKRTSGSNTSQKWKNRIDGFYVDSQGTLAETTLRRKDNVVQRHSQKHQQSDLHQLVQVESPDDMKYEGKFREPTSTGPEHTAKTNVVVDSPDDVEA